MIVHATDTPAPREGKDVERVVAMNCADRRRHRRISVAGWLTFVLAALFCLAIVWPFVVGAGWEQLRHPVFDSDDGHAVIVSLLCAAADAILMILLATPLSWILARREFPGKVLLEALALVPLLTPPLAMGMLLANVLGPESMLGQLADRVGISVTNSIPALIIAGFYAAAPFYVFGAKLAFESVHPGYEEMARLLGKSRIAAWLGVTLPLALGGLFWALVIGWLRAMGEFGVAIIIAYFPHGIPIQMWVNLQDSGPHAVYPLLWMLILLAMPVPLLLSLQVRRGWKDWYGVVGGLATILCSFTAPKAEDLDKYQAASGHAQPVSLHIHTQISSPVRLHADFTVRGITALTGPTGSGKTTLLRAIAGLISNNPTPETQSALAGLRIGYAPQQPLLFPHLSALHNVAFGIHSPLRQRRAMDSLRQLGLEHLADRMPALLSAGQAQLVSIARAVASEPDILLLDEPTAALDFETSDALLVVLRDIARARNIPILLATHDRDVARSADVWYGIHNGGLSIAEVPVHRV